MSSVVPDGWENRQFGQFCREKSVKFDGKSELPVLSVTKYDGFVSSLDYFNKQVFSRDLSSYKVVRKGQFAYATIHLDEGSLGLLSDYDGGLISPMYTVFETTQECNSKFLFFLMKSDLYMTKYPALGQGSINRRMSISFRSLSELNIATPPLSEQKKIASILTSVDEVIENTKKQIDKLQDLKKATMNELLTKGIGHTEFKDSELGRIPKSWEVKKFGSITSSIKSGLSRRLSSQDIGIPVINSGNLSPRGLNIDELKYWYIDDPQGANIKNYFLQEGDILLNFINSTAQIGKSCVFESIGRDCIYTTNLFRIRVGSSIISLFLHYLMTQERFRKEISLITKPAVNQASFTKDELENILVPTPPISEQDLILKSLSGIESQITAIYKKLSQTQSLKKSLMQDLLTGKVRVTVS